MYEIRCIKRVNDRDVILAFEECFEHPSEEYLDKLVRSSGATFADVCRIDDKNEEF